MLYYFSCRSAASALKEAAQPETTPPPENSVPWWEGKYALTDWGGAREDLEKRGIVFDIRYAGELRNNAAGGLNTSHATEYIGDLNVAFDLFTDKFGLYEGGEFYVRFESVEGHGISKRGVGDVRVLSSIDAPEFSQLSRLFYHSILDDRLRRFKIGKQTAQHSIAPKYGVDFTHSAFGCISTVPLPRFFVYRLKPRFILSTPPNG